MPGRETKAAKHRSAADTSEAVDEFMVTLKHPSIAEISALRTIVVGVDKSIGEGIKWNAPSFRTSEYFATTNLRAKAGIGLVLHLGAKVRELPVGGVKITDPTKLLRWLAEDRAMVEFTSLKDIKENAAALQAVVRQWIRYV